MLKITLLLITLLVGIVNCGQKGDLVLPDVELDKKVQHKGRI